MFLFSMIYKGALHNTLLFTKLFVYNVRTFSFTVRLISLAVCNESIMFILVIWNHNNNILHTYVICLVINWLCIQVILL